MMTLIVLTSALVLMRRSSELSGTRPEIYAEANGGNRRLRLEFVIIASGSLQAVS
jgi:hypothetical protein